MKKIDLDITEIRKRIAEASLGIEFQQLMTFSIGDTIDSHKGIKSQGIYLFEVKCSSLDDLTALKNIWESYRKTGSIKNTPKLIKSRFDNWSKKISEPMWIPMYIGKSEDLAKRIDEHINLNLDSSTYSMKLKHWPQLKGYTFKCSIIKLELKNYDWIATDIEQYMRTQYNPIIGKQ